MASNKEIANPALAVLRSQLKLVNSAMKKTSIIKDKASSLTANKGKGQTSEDTPRKEVEDASKNMVSGVVESPSEVDS